MMAEKECIERGAAYTFFKDQLEEETGAYSKGRNAGLRVAMSAVMNKDAIPAADVRTVVRGKWEPWGYKGYGLLPVRGLKCSICGVLMDGIERPEEYHLNYCPNCGADMREER